MRAASSRDWELAGDSSVESCCLTVTCFFALFVLCGLSLSLFVVACFKYNTRLCERRNLESHPAAPPVLPCRYLVLVLLHPDLSRPHPFASGDHHFVLPLASFALNATPSQNPLILYSPSSSPPPCPTLRLPSLSVITVPVPIQPHPSVLSRRRPEVQ